MSAGLVTFLQPMTLYDEHERPFTAFVIEVKTERSQCWRIQKRFESFAKLQRAVGPAHPLVLPMPAAQPQQPQGPSDFMQEVCNSHVLIFFFFCTRTKTIKKSPYNRCPKVTLI
jgi:hypothetical protein